MPGAAAGQCAPPHSAPLAFTAAASTLDARRSVCTAQGLTLPDDAQPAFGAVSLAAPLRPRPAASTLGVAVCLTGQLRGLPVAVLNWRAASLLDVLRAGGLDLDFFVVTSNSSSYATWAPFVASLRPERVITVAPAIRFNRTAATDRWAHRLVDGTLEFNLHRYPWVRHHKYGTVLVQQWQLAQCREAILEREAATGGLYSRVARLRTDVVFSGLLPRLWPSPRAAETIYGAPRAPTDGAVEAAAPAYLECLAAGGGGVGASACDAILVAERARLAKACADHLADLESSREEWLVGTDLYLYGSRDVMVKGYLRGLRALERARAEENVTLIHHVVDAWRHVGVAASAALGARRLVHHGGACAHALADYDIVRAAGPPARRFFLQRSETAESLAPCLAARGTSVAACMRARIEDSFRLPLAAISSCVQLDYDLASGWRFNASECAAREVEAELVRAHVRNFGGSLVGDLRGWAHGKARSTQWAHDWVGKFEPPADGFS